MILLFASLAIFHANSHVSMALVIQIVITVKYQLDTTATMEDADLVALQELYY